MPAGNAKEFAKNALLTLCSLVLFYAVLEMGARFLSDPEKKPLEDPYVGFSGKNPLFVKKDTLNSRYYVTSEKKLKFFNSQIFPVKKAEGTFRVFCLGGSTTYGRPYNSKTSFSGWLEAYLSSLYPSKKFEVINAGGISYASYRVAELMVELSGYQPDAFVIYSGHNEFLEERTYGSLKKLPKWLLRSDQKLMSSKLYSLAKSQVVRWKSPEPKQGSQKAKLSSEVETILENSVGPTSYYRDDSLSDNIARHYEISLRRMEKIAKSAKAEILFVTTPSNLKDCSPFKSQRSPGLSETDSIAAAALEANAHRFLTENNWDSANAHFKAAMSLDPRNSRLLYHYGKALLGQGRLDSAKSLLVRARDEDVCPLRATSDLIEVQLSFFKELKLPYIPWVEIMERQAVQETHTDILGREYFLDHVHMSIESHRRLALNLISTMQKLGWVSAEKMLTKKQLDSVRDSITATVNNAQVARSLNNLAKVYNWAGKLEDAVGLAKKALSLDTTNLETAAGALLVGAHYHRQNNLDSALYYYQLTLNKDSNNMEAHRFTGIAMYSLKQYEEALPHLGVCLSLNPGDFEIQRLLALSLLFSKRYDESEAQFLSLLRRFPNDVNLLFNYGRSLHGQGKLKEASDIWKRVLALNPGHRGAAEGLQKLRGGTGENPFQKKLTPAQQKAFNDLKRKLRNGF